MPDHEEERRGVPFVVSAPSGCGKTTICQAVLESDPGVVFSVSHTTRKKRGKEVAGKDYHFISISEFRAMVDGDEFLESAEYASNLYGTSWAEIEDPLSRGVDVLLEIEIQGARQIRERLSDAKLIFILPPSLKDLEQRLRDRGTESSEAIDRRLAVAAEEMRQVRWYDYAVVNSDLEQAIQSVLEIVRLEREGSVDKLQEKYGQEVALAWLRDSLVSGS